MQRRFLKILSLAMGFGMAFSSGCSALGGDKAEESSVEHQHAFTQKVNEEAYLKAEKSCAGPAEYYYSCECGEKGEDTYTVGMKDLHDYSAVVAEDRYIKTEATCQAVATYYQSCTKCGASSAPYGKTFTAGDVGDHKYTEEKPDGKYLASEATKTTSAVFYKSCACGEVGEETFTYGDPLKELTEEEKKAYAPVSLTMTLYDPENSVYGFTYNTQSQPMRPVIQYEKGDTLTENAQEVSVSFSKWGSYDKEGDTDVWIEYYVAKAELTLEPSETYTYRVYDKYAEIGTEPVTMQTRDTSSTAFTFSHVSDTQSSPSSGGNFSIVLDEIGDNSDFILHTGDIVEYSRYEYEWTDMLHTNFEYLSKTPIMALPGNHDTTYKSGDNGSSELTKHFHNKIPDQPSVKYGYYYSFVYGNAKFIMLNTNNNATGALDQTQYDWLIGELENNDSDWLIVAMHAPLYSIGQWGADPDKNGQSLALRGQLKDVFARYGVDLVFQGHDHLLSRTNPITEGGVPSAETWRTENEVEYSIDPNGVIYVMDGTVGTGVKSVVDVEEGVYKYAQASAACTWADITIDGDTLTFEVKSAVIGAETVTRQKWGIQKTGNAVA